MTTPWQPDPADYDILVARCDHAEGACADEAAPGARASKEGGGRGRCVQAWVRELPGLGALSAPTAAQARQRALQALAAELERRRRAGLPVPVPTHSQRGGYHG